MRCGVQLYSECLSIALFALHFPHRNEPETFVMQILSRKLAQWHAFIVSLTENICGAFNSCKERRRDLARIFAIFLDLFREYSENAFRFFAYYYYNVSSMIYCGERRISEAFNRHNLVRR